jgi:toxin ParE1/3/4
MRLEIAVRARRDLDEIHRYGLDHYGAARADAYLAELFAKFRYVAEWPHTAPERFAMRSTVRLSRMRAHNIIYIIEREVVTVLRIFHHSVNWIDLL